MLSPDHTLLLIDAGNTALKYRLVPASGSPQDYGVYPDAGPDWQAPVQGLEADAVWISDVRGGEIPVPANLPVQRISASLHLPFTGAAELLESLGADRLCLFAALTELVPEEEAACAISLGTAITYNVLMPGRQAAGGAISPGVDMRFKSLHAFTGKLPLVEAETSEMLFPAPATRPAIQTGVMMGIQFEIEGFIHRLEEELQVPLTCFLTGGNAPYFENHLKKRNFVIPDLVLRGLYRLAILNRNE